MESVMLVSCLWSWGLAYSVLDIPLDKADFLFLSKNQLEIASWVAVGLCVHFFHMSST